MDAERRKHVHCTYGNLLNYKTLAQSAAYIGAEVALDQASALASPVVGELAKDAGQHLRGSALLQATSRGWPSRLSMPFRGQKHREQALLDSEGGPASDDGFERQETMNMCMQGPLARDARGRAPSKRASDGRRRGGSAEGILRQRLGELGLLRRVTPE